MRDQLSSILTSIEKLEELDTAAIPPTAQTIELVDVLRETWRARRSPRAGADERATPARRLLRGRHAIRR